ncbi:hypothetical protein GYA49_01455 [Candidatus Beckwithbacteria bacterium]|nr:hypothetical protein [Candidatus Beckwithbacteria bacterium]
MPLKKQNFLDVVIVDPNHVVYEGKAKRVFAPGKIADLALLPEHTPLYTELIEGTIQIEEESGQKIEEKIDGGVARIKNNTLTILIGF